MTEGQGRSRRRFRAPPRPGTDRWFRGYRRYLLWAWAAVLLLGVWVLACHDDRPATVTTPSPAAAVQPLPEKLPSAPASVAPNPVSAKSRK